MRLEAWAVSSVTQVRIEAKNESNVEYTFVEVRGLIPNFLVT